MIRDIVTDPKFLSHKASVATPLDRMIGQDLRDTLVAHQETCLGLAANMIGFQKRVIIISLGVFALVMYNPKLLTKRFPYQTEEGCLSLMGTRPTKRYREITVSYLDENWQEKTMSLEGLAAQICQHELDHLEGILI